MSKLDKEKVLSEFSQAYKAANGKAPKIEESPGWYSVDGSKNMRLAKLAEWTEELLGGAAEPASAAKPAAKAKKAAPKASPKAAMKVKSKAKGGLSAKEQWQQYLVSQAGASKAPRGF
ncbi:hypothetical protein CWE15_02245 [Aliidiomarina taiwanensis]|uniref:Uncharacterized protein n=1 Tax=Aliidiomarina taiwanensis TaxID=946228 RepID=A0A432X9D2_9GAMM|nr:hypothetical protein [Aliidiomarina taiwanensis]RUO44022.1 hypothetical protein CWE15_02245 [Aliidiomarina taiwanensis]